jgi:hypothetical protein
VHASICLGGPGQQMLMAWVVRAKKGVHVQSRGNEPLPVDMVKLLKTQDVKYLQTMRSTEEKVSSV